MTGEDYLAEVLGWLGTPFLWQASLKGVGCDCKGLVWGAARALGLPEADSPWAAIIDYPTAVPVHTLRQGLEATLRRVEAPAIGDVLLLTQAGKAQHLGVYGGRRMVHTYPHVGRVTASSSAGAVLAWPLDSVWRFRSLEPNHGV